MIHDYVIVGAGLAGATTAWHLVRGGATDVVLLEQETMPGVHSSGRNVGFVRERTAEPRWQEFTSRGAAVLRKGALADFRPCGSVLLGLGDSDLSERIPRARGRGLWCPQDGMLDVAALLAGYLRGRDVRCGWRLECFEAGDDALRLHTNRGEIGARVLVNAAGPWARPVGDLALTPMNRHVFVTRPMAWVDPGWLFVLDAMNGLYFSKGSPRRPPWCRTS